MAKEIERAGIPTALVSTIVPLAQSVGPNRIVAGRAVIHPVGDPSLSRDEELAFRRRLVRNALDALQTDATTPLVIPLEASSAASEVARTGSRAPVQGTEGAELPVRPIPRARA